MDPDQKQSYSFRDENMLNRNSLAFACRVMDKLCLPNLIVRYEAEINNADDN